MLDDIDLWKRRIRWRAHHRGTKEADLMIGGFCEAHIDSWGPDEMSWFEALLEEQDVDIMAWAMGRGEPPEKFRGALLEAMLKMDYVKVAK